MTNNKSPIFFTVLLLVASIVGITFCDKLSTFEFQTKGRITTASLFEHNYGDAWGASYAYGDLWWAQTFTPSTGHKITRVRLYVSRQGYPGIVTVSISAVEDTIPVGKDLIVTMVQGNCFSVDKQWEEIVFNNELTLEANTMYAIVVRCLSGDGNNYLVWWEGDVYSGGTLCDGKFWGEVVHWKSREGMDLIFEEWGL